MPGREKQTNRTAPNGSGEKQTRWDGRDRIKQKKYSLFIKENQNDWQQTNKPTNRAPQCKPTHQSACKRCSKTPRENQWLRKLRNFYSNQLLQITIELYHVEPYLHR
uniref:Uncharacterized protein n=1 Tax=Anopheles atroparvus TaxID=41427 RepID=A0AAG5D2D7_ANOAO